MIGLMFAILGAVASVVIAGIGSIIAVGKAGQAGAGVVSEEPEKFGNVLLLQALPATQGIYGFIGTFWVLLSLGLLKGTIPTLDWRQGVAIFLATMPVTIGGLVSAIYQGRVSVSGLNVVTKQPAASGKAVIMAAMVETYAVLGLLATILLVRGLTSNLG